MGYKAVSPLPVEEGGTEAESFTAFAVLCGGTTPTTAIEPIVSVGTSGQVLTSNGAGALPTFQAASSGGITSITGDTGGTQTGPAITLIGNGSLSAGSTVLFSGSTNTITLKMSDGNENTFVGLSSGPATLSGSSNTFFGTATGNHITTGSANTGVGFSAGELLTTGEFNTLIGTQSGENYISSETSNICINNSGITAESNTCRIASGTGTGAYQLTRTFISGIRGITTGAGNGIPIYIDSNGQLGTAGGSLGAISSITGDTGGSQTGPAITLTGGSTGASFGGSSNTITMTFAGVTANGGTVSLATDATTSTVNIGTGAGAKTVTIGSTNGASSLALANGTGNFSLTSATGTVISALAAGEVTMPLQPAFLVRLATSLTNVTGDGTFYGIVFDTIVYDQGSNVNLSGPPTIFTAPVTGKYNFTCCAFFTGLGAGFTDARINIISTTAGQVVVTRINPSSINVGGLLVVGGNVYINMTSGDTTFVQIYVGSSTKTIGLLGDASALTTYFSGVLVV